VRFHDPLGDVEAETLAANISQPPKSLVILISAA